jgi:hypothetical protein
MHKLWFACQLADGDMTIIALHRWLLFSVCLISMIPYGLQEENQTSRTCKDDSTTGCMMEIPSVNVQNYNGEETLVEHSL